MYGGVYTGGVILPNTFKMAAWGNKQKSAHMFTQMELCNKAAKVNKSVKNF